MTALANNRIYEDALLSQSRSETRVIKFLILRNRVLELILQMADDLGVNGPAQFLDAAEHVDDIFSIFLIEASWRVDVDPAGIG
jgi:hypothetical protein